MAREWEEDAAEILQKLDRLQEEAPIDVSGYLLDARRNVDHALTQYRENRADDQSLKPR